MLNFNGKVNSVNVAPVFNLNTSHVKLQPNTSLWKKV